MGHVGNTTKTSSVKVNFPSLYQKTKNVCIKYPRFPLTIVLFENHLSSVVCWGRGGTVNQKNSFSYNSL